MIGNMGKKQSLSLPMIAIIIGGVLWLTGGLEQFGIPAPAFAAAPGVAPGETVGVCTVPDDGKAYFAASSHKSIETTAGAITAQTATLTVCKDGSRIAVANRTVAGSMSITGDYENYDPSGAARYTMYLGPAIGTAAAAGEEYHTVFPNVGANCVKNPDGGWEGRVDVVGAMTLTAKNQSGAVASTAESMLASGDAMTITVKQTTNDATLRLSPAGELGVCIHYPAANISEWVVTNINGQGASSVSTGDTAHSSASSTTTVGTTPTAKCYAVQVGGSDSVTGAKVLADQGATVSFVVTPTFAAGTGTNTSATVYAMDWGSIMSDCGGVTTGWAYEATTGMTDFGIADGSFAIDFGSAT